MSGMRVPWFVPALTGLLLVVLGVMAIRTGPGLNASAHGVPRLNVPRFDAPAGQRSTEPGAPGRRTSRTPDGATSIPVRVVTTGRATLVLVPVKVNDRGPFDFVLDTGASTSTVDRSLVRRLRLPRTGRTARVRGVTGESIVPLIRLRAWTLGGEALAGRSLTVTDMGEPGVFGLLGSDELRRFGRITVDYQRKLLIIRESRNSGGSG